MEASLAEKFSTVHDRKFDFRVRNGVSYMIIGAVYGCTINDLCHPSGHRRLQ